MSTRVYLVSYVPVADRDAAELAVAPLLQSPNDPGVYTFAVPLVPLAGPGDATPTHYGVCAPFLDTYLGALPSLAVAIPAVVYAVVSPWRQFDLALHWTGLLTQGGLKIRQTAI